MRAWILVAGLLGLSAGALAIPVTAPPGLGLEPPGPPSFGTPPFEVPVGPPADVPSLPSIPDVAQGPPGDVGPPDGVPPVPNVPAHGEFPLENVPPANPPGGPPSPVPEPGTALLLLAGLVGLARAGRGRR